MRRIGILIVIGLGMGRVAWAAEGVIDFGVKGGWCWFQDERAIVDGGQLIFGSVASPSGDIQVTAYNLSTRKALTVVLHEKLQSDDHDAPALLKLADGRYLAKYAMHGNTRFMYWRISKRPGDASEWEAEQKLDVGAGVTYMNVYRLAGENGRIYNFHRGVGFNPNYLVSEDEGRTFRYGGRLVEWVNPTKRAGSGRPYVRYASNGVDAIHFIITEDHPHQFDNSIYHGYLKGGKLHRSDGSVAGELSATKASTLKPTDFTRVFKGDADHVAWTVDIRLDGEGRPYVAFSVQKDNDGGKKEMKLRGEDNRYYYGRWDGSRWEVNELAHAGQRLYVPEVAYTGLVALHPGDRDVVYISSNAEPASGKALISAADGKRHWEIFKGMTADGGKTWKWTAMTRDSSEDNIRPIARVIDGGKTMVIWQRGRYLTYTKYDVRVVGAVDGGR